MPRARREQQLWRIEEIVTHRDGREGTEYLIKWPAWDELTWIKLEDFFNCNDDLAKYWGRTADFNAEEFNMLGKYRKDLIPWYKAYTLATATDTWDYTNVDSRFEDLIEGIIPRIPERAAKIRLLITHIVELEVYGETFPREEALRLREQAEQEQQEMQQQQQQQQQQEIQLHQHQVVEVPVVVDEQVGENLVLEENVEVGAAPSAGRSVAYKRKKPKVLLPKTKSARLRSPPPPIPEAQSEEEEECADVEADDEEDGRFHCVSKGCDKSFGTNKQLVDHRRYHKNQMACCFRSEGCDWMGAIKKLNTHIRESHLHIFPFCGHCQAPVISAKVSEHRRKCSKWTVEKRAEFLSRQQGKYPNATNVLDDDGAARVAEARTRSTQDDSSEADGDDD